MRWIVALVACVGTVFVWALGVDLLGLGWTHWSLGLSARLVPAGAVLAIGVLIPLFIWSVGSFW